LIDLSVILPISRDKYRLISCAVSSLLRPLFIIPPLPSLPLRNSSKASVLLLSSTAKLYLAPSNSFPAPIFPRSSRVKPNKLPYKSLALSDTSLRPKALPLLSFSVI